MARTASLALCVQAETQYGTQRLVARMVLVTPDGLRDPLWQRGSDPHRALADFQVHAYLDRDNEHAQCPGHSFNPVWVELDQAESIVRVLRKIRRGLDAAEKDSGYLPADDFAAYLFRITAILRIRTYYVRNTDKGRAISGETFRRTDATGLQYWIADREKSSASPAPNPTLPKPWWRTKPQCAITEEQDNAMTSTTSTTVYYARCRAPIDHTNRSTPPMDTSGHRHGRLPYRTRRSPVWEATPWGVKSLADMPRIGTDAPIPAAPRKGFPADILIGPCHAPNGGISARARHVTIVEIDTNNALPERATAALDSSPGTPGR